MKSATSGKNISAAEVTNISRHAFWLFVADEELFVACKEFPWFKDASVAELINVQWPQPHHLCWPDLNVDLAVESIKHPKKFSLVPKALRSTRRPTRRAKMARLVRRKESKDKSGVPDSQFRDRQLNTMPANKRMQRSRDSGASLAVASH